MEIAQDIARLRGYSDDMRRIADMQLRAMDQLQSKIDASDDFTLNDPLAETEASRARAKVAAAMRDLDQPDTSDTHQH